MPTVQTLLGGCYTLAAREIRSRHLRKVTFQPIESLQKRIEDVVRVQSKQPDSQEPKLVELVDAAV